MTGGRGSVERLGAERLSGSWRAGCPAAIEALRLLRVPYVGFDGEAHVGELVVHADWAEAVLDVFAELAAARFPIERMQLVDAYDGDDERSMAANNTSGFNGRYIARLAREHVWSEHAYGRAIDVNPVQNPYLVAGRVSPAAAAAFVDRSQDAPGMIHPGGVVVRAFARIGWKWGGTWDEPCDYHHFSATGR